MSPPTFVGARCAAAPVCPTRTRGIPRSSMDKARITSYRDGPLLVRGPFRLEDQDGNPIDAGRETIALCRCGKSRMRPFCDGTHKLVRFRAPSGAESGRGG
jgi:CDGSH-type Zn-finger protein